MFFIFFLHGSCVHVCMTNICLKMNQQSWYSQFRHQFPSKQPSFSNTNFNILSVQWSQPNACFVYQTFAVDPHLSLYLSITFQDIKCSSVNVRLSIFPQYTMHCMNGILFLAFYSVIHQKHGDVHKCCWTHPLKLLKMQQDNNFGSFVLFCFFFLLSFFFFILKFRIHVSFNDNNHCWNLGAARDFRTWIGWFGYFFRLFFSTNRLFT